MKVLVTGAAGFIGFHLVEALVKEDTPVFTIIEPVSILMDKSKPKCPLILVIWTFLGGIVGVGMVFGKEFFTGIKDKWKEEDANFAN